MKKEETERKIRELQERISADSKKLAELTSDFSVDIDEELDKYKKTIEFMKKIGIWLHSNLKETAENNTLKEIFQVILLRIRKE